MIGSPAAPSTLEHWLDKGPETALGVDLEKHLNELREIGFASNLTRALGFLEDGGYNYRRFMRNKVARAGLGLVLALYCVAILAPLLAPADPNAPPSPEGRPAT